MNTKRFLFGIAMVVAGWTAAAQPVAPPASTSPQAASGETAPRQGVPRIEFESTVYNFNKINQGEVVKHSFVFTNTGASTLQILDVKPGCGCTTAGAWDKTVEPGKTGVVPLQLNSTGFGGTITKSATVTCNDPNRPTVMLQLTGSVWKPIEVTPMTAVFNYSGDPQTNDTKVMRIVNNLEEPLTLSDVQCSNPSFRTELKTVAPGKEFELHVTAVPPFSNRTTFATVTMKTSSARSPTLSVTAYAMVQPAILVSPEQIYLPSGPLVNAMNPSVTIRANGTNLLALSEPSITLTGATVKITELQPGRLFSVAASFPAGFKVSPGQLSEITLKSNHPKQPVIRVPVFQQQVPPSAKSALAPNAQIPSVARPLPTPATSLRTVPAKSTPAPTPPPTTSGK